MFRALSLACAMITVASAASPASAANYVYYAPLQVKLGDQTAEVYTPYVFQAHDGLAGRVLVDAALKELAKLLPAELAAIKVEVKAGRVDLTLASDRAADSALYDRALGAVFHTLKAAGIDAVMLDGTRLVATRFTRGANAPVLPMAAALPPTKLGYGYVRVGEVVMFAEDFYRRLAVGDQTIRDAALAQLESGPPTVKLALLAGLPSLRFPDSTAVLVPRLLDRSAAVRLKTLAALEGNKAPQVLKALELVVDKDPDGDAKIAAVKLLVAGGQQKYAQYLLLEKLKSPDAALVAEAARGLIASGEARFGPSLVPLVKHPDPGVRKVAVEGLQKLKQYEAIATLVGDALVAKDLAEALARTLADEDTGPRQARGVAWLLTEGSPDGAVYAANLAASKRVPGITQALGKALARSEAPVRKAAATALGTLKDPAGLEPLAVAVRGAGAEDERDLFTEQAIAIIAVQPLAQVIKISESPDATVRALAIKSLAEFAKGKPNPQVLSVLKARLQDSDKGIKRAAVFALARIDDDAVVGDLLSLKDDPDADIRRQITFALGRSKHPQANGQLLAYLDDRDNLVKQEAATAIGARKVEAAMNKLKNLAKYRHDGVRVAVWKAIVAMAPSEDAASFDLWSEGLYDKSPEVRIMAIDQLKAYTTDQRAALAIGGAVGDQDVKVKLHAIAVLSESKDPNAVEQVIRGLFDTDKAIKMAALDALEKLNSPKAMKALTEFIANESDKDVKQRAEAVMGNL